MMHIFRLGLKDLSAWMNSGSPLKGVAKARRRITGRPDKTPRRARADCFSLVVTFAIGMHFY